MTELQIRNARRVRMELTQSLLVEPVPGVHNAIRSSRGKCLVLVVEADGIHRIDLLHFVLLHAMTLEGELSLLHFRFRIKVLHSDTSLNRTHHVALFVREDPDDAGLELQGRLPSHEVLGHVPEIPDEHSPVAGGHRNLLVVYVHTVDASIVLFISAHALLVPNVPQFDGLVPGTGDHSSYLTRVHHTSHRVRVLANLGLCLSIQIVSNDLIGEEARDDLCGFLEGNRKMLFGGR